MTLRTALLCIAFVAPVAAAGAEVREWRFDVFLDDAPIGQHEFRLIETGTTTRIDSRAKFDRRVFRVPVFSYLHESTEYWNDDCLLTIASRTQQNRDDFMLQGNRTTQGFELRTAAGKGLLPACVRSFAYWNPRLLESRSLLNAQTGEYAPARFELVGEEILRLGERSTAAVHYRLTTAEDEIELWYSPRGEWLALESLVRRDRVLRYELNGPWG
jgi:hypothetical protein